MYEVWDVVESQPHCNTARVEPWQDGPSDDQSEVVQGSERRYDQPVVVKGWCGVDDPRRQNMAQTVALLT